MTSQTCKVGGRHLEGLCATEPCARGRLHARRGVDCAPPLGRSQLTACRTWIPAGAPKATYTDEVRSTNRLTRTVGLAPCGGGAPIEAGRRVAALICRRLAPTAARARARGQLTDGPNALTALNRDRSTRHRMGELSHLMKDDGRASCVPHLRNL